MKDVLRGLDPCKIGFYKHHCSAVEGICEENKSKAAMIKVFEARFSKELAKNPIEMPSGQHGNVQRPCRTRSH